MSLPCFIIHHISNSRTLNLQTLQYLIRTIPISFWVIFNFLPEDGFNNLKILFTDGAQTWQGREGLPIPPNVNGFPATSLSTGVSGGDSLTASAGVGNFYDNYAATSNPRIFSGADTTEDGNLTPWSDFQSVVCYFSKLKMLIKLILLQQNQFEQRLNQLPVPDLTQPSGSSFNSDRGNIGISGVASSLPTVSSSFYSGPVSTNPTYNNSQVGSSNVPLPTDPYGICRTNDETVGSSNSFNTHRGSHKVDEHVRSHSSNSSTGSSDRNSKRGRHDSSEYVY